MRKVGLILIVVLAVILVLGHIYQTAGTMKDAERYKPVGRFYEVHGDKMHLYAGDTGDTTVVLASGWGTVNPYADFYPLYAGISQYARFVVYDRFGYGFSDIVDKPRDIDTIVDEIQELLTVSGEKPPYIFVGHSLGSLETIRYAQRYPGQVKGIVLIDGGNPSLYANTKPRTMLSILQRQLIRFGIARLLYKTDWFTDHLNSERNALSLLPNEIRELDKISTLLRAHNVNVTDELRKSQNNASLVVSGGTLGDIPLIIVTSGDFGKANPQWIESQENLKGWSTRSKQIMVDDTKHYIHHYHPEIITQAITDLIDIRPHTRDFGRE